MVKANFRSDINGLRAIAVIAVVLFHFKLQGFSGGFVGVDIFFVISGYLMTGIIIKGIESSSSKKFNIFEFYMARARRIIPALLILCLILLVVGWFLITPDDYVKLAREADRALLFISNNHYYKNSGYFDTDSHERLLLHTWSLSIEWQFYILYPLVLLLLSKMGFKSLPYTIFALLIASFAWSVYKSYADPSSAFYLLPSRAWEMMLGGIVFYLSRKYFLEKYKSKLFYLGLFLILVSIFAYDPLTRWPGSAALLPTIGTALIIFAAKNSLLMSNSIVQRLGDWSYSIYLWHWPLAVVLVLMGIDEFTWLSIVFVFLSILLGWLSFSLIENPLRKYFSNQKKWITLIIILLALSVVLIPAEKIRKNKGYIERTPDSVYQVLSAENDRFYEMEKCHKKRKENDQDCIYGEGEIGAIVMGDSHAMSFMVMVVDAYKAQEKSVLDLSAGGCPTLRGVKSLGSEECHDFLNLAFSRLDQHKGVPVYLANRYSASLLGGNEKDSSTRPNLYFKKVHSEFDEKYTQEIYSNYVESICAVAENNPVFIFRSVPELIEHVPKVMGRSMLYKGKETRVSVTREYYDARNMWANRLIDDVVKRCAVMPIDVADYLCDENNCYGDIAGQPVYFDDDHLNTKGALLLQEHVIKQVEAFD